MTLFQSACIQEGITNIAVDNFQIIVVSNQVNESDADAFDDGSSSIEASSINAMPSSNQPGFSCQIWFHCEDKAQRYFLVIQPQLEMWGLEFKASECNERGDFLMDRLFPKVISVTLIQLIGLFNTIRDSHPVQCLA